ncbi:MAG: DUF1858 domain-containing protein [Lachnospiraceae bacterium]|nr:DUF1858 domain-containing protein [Lachnospiraceae bacterium]
MRINENTKIGELLEAYPDMAGLLTEMGMHCIGCPSARGETLVQAAEVHGIDPDDLLEDLKGFIESMQ